MNLKMRFQLIRSIFGKKVYKDMTSFIISLGNMSRFAPVAQLVRAPGC